MKNHGWLFTRVYHTLRNGLIVLVLLCYSQGATSQQLTITTDQEGPIRADQLRVVFDDNNTVDSQPTHTLINTLRWQPVHDVPLNLGYSQHPVWVHLRLHNPTKQTQERLLELAYPLLDDIQIWAFSGVQPIHVNTMGDQYPFAQRAIQHRNFLQRLTVDSGATIDVYLRVDSSSSLQLPLSLWRPDSLTAITAKYSLLMGIYYGTLLVMLLYNISIYVNGRDNKYLCYVFYLASIGILFASINGTAFQYFWPKLPNLTNTVIIGSLGSTILFASIFSSSFLGLANTRPYFSRALSLISIGAALIILGGVLLPYSWVIQPAIALALVATATTITCGIACWRDGQSAAMLFTLAWLVLLVGAALMGLCKLGWLPRNSVTEHTAQIGSMMEFVLFSLALIRQLNAERRAKYAAQRSALAFERQASESRQHALELQRQTTDELELRVRQRTRELQVLNEKLRTLSTTDPLTGLKNRRYFNERFLAEFSRSKRDGTPISVIIIDVDHFKAVNDTYGHLLGDELLKVVAHHISTQAKRESDIIARHGGEEFSAVLINNTPAQAWDMSEKICRRIAMACYQAEDLSLHCTVSIGVATMVPQKHHVAEVLIKQADDALYRAKAEGRNRVSVFTQQAA
jgi:diguanylate cyclase (GGDEF)-like protein